MLEQAARCLDSGVYIRWRTLTTIRRPQQGLRTRRHIHSTFWHHGACDLSLPTYCFETFSELFEPLHTTSLTYLPWIDGNSNYASKWSRIPFDDLSLPLRLIIPREAHALVKRWSTRGKRYWQLHISAFQREQMFRTFTSIRTTLSSRRDQAVPGTSSAQDPAVEKANEESTSESARISAKTLEFDDSSFELTPQSLQQRVGRLLRNEDKRSVIEAADELWDAYELLPNKSKQAKVKKELLLFLSGSERIVDAHRIARLYSSMTDVEHDQQVISAVVVAFINMNKLDEAHIVHERLYDLSFSGIPDFKATEKLLLHDIQMRDWSRVIHVWETCYTFHSSHNTSFTAYQHWRKGLPKKLSQASDLLERMKSFLEFVSDNDQYQSYENVPFLCTQLMSALFVPDVAEKFASDVRVDIVQKAQELRLLHPAFSTQVFQYFQTASANTKLDEALRLYYQFFKDPDFIPPRFAIEYLAACTSKARLYDFLSRLEDDWRKFHGAPSADLTVSLMHSYAPRGMVTKIDDLINEYTKDRKPDTMGFFYPVLRAESIRYGALAVRRRLGFIREHFSFSPDLMCWNIVLHGYARHHDLDGALEGVSKMIEIGHRPDAYTIKTILSICAQRGGTDLAKAYLQYAVNNGLKVDQQMYEHVVLAHVNDLKYGRALRLAEEVTLLAPDQSTRLWTIIMANLATRRRYKRALIVSRKMRELGVPFNGPAYAALMRIFTVNYQPQVALHIMSKVMRADQVRPSQLHFAILIDGYASIGDYEIALRAYSRMLKEGLRPDFNVRLAILKVHGLATKNRVSLNIERGRQDQYHTSEELFAEVLEDDPTQDLTMSGPRLLQHQLAPSQASPASYFDTLFMVYGRERTFEKVEMMLRHYNTLKAKVSGEDTFAMPLRFLHVLMRARQNEEDHESLDQLWHLSLQSASSTARTYSKKAPTKKQKSPNVSEIDMETFEPSESVPGKNQYLLAQHFNVYIESLAMRGQFSTIISTIASVSEAGFKLDNSNWNNYAQILCRHGFTLEAFELVERVLMPRTRGIKYYKSATSFSQRRRRDAGMEFTGPHESLRPGQMHGLYPTFAHLRRALADLGDVRCGGEPNVVPIDSEGMEPGTASEFSSQQELGESCTNDMQDDPAPSSQKDPMPSITSGEHELEHLLASTDTIPDSHDDDLEGAGIGPQRTRAKSPAEREKILEQIQAQAPETVKAVRLLPRADNRAAREILGEQPTIRKIPSMREGRRTREALKAEKEAREEPEPEPGADLDWWEANSAASESQSLGL